MNHLFKSESVKKLVQYNKMLLLCLAISLVIILIISVMLTSKQERWVLIPAIDVDRKMNLTNRTYNSSYLSEWARFVVKEIFTTSPDEVDKQIASIRRISSSNQNLNDFFSQQLEFVKGSRVNSVFYFKEATLEGKDIKIYGTINYWFGDSNTTVAQEKIYLLSYKITNNGLLLLTNIKEIRQKQLPDSNSSD